MVKWLCIVLSSAVIFLLLHISLQAQNLATLREILNDVWDNANNRLMTTPGVGAQGSFETEVTIFNDVWDKENHQLRVSGAGGEGGGDFSSNTATSVDSEVVLFSGTGGKTGKRATGTGVAHLTDGVLSASNVDLSTEVTGDLSVSNLNGGTAADSTTFWRGDGSWATPSTVGGSFAQQTGTSYTMQASDSNKLVFFTSGAGVAVTFPQANTAGFTSGNIFYIRAISSQVTITPTTSTINGKSSIKLNPEDVATIRSDSTNYVATVSLGARFVTVECIADGSDVTTGDGKCYFPINAEFDQTVVFSVSAHVGAAVSSSGAVNVDIDRCAATATGIRCSGTATDVLSTNITIDANESGTETAATPAVISGAGATVSTGQWLRFNVDGAGTGTQGLYVTVGLKGI